MTSPITLLSPPEIQSPRAGSGVLPSSSINKTASSPAARSFGFEPGWL